MINFSDTTVNSFPFPHAITPNTLEKSMLDTLIIEFPRFEKIKRHENVMGGRRRLASDTASFYEFIEGSHAWRELYDTVNSKGFVDELLNSYGGHLKEAGCKIQEYEFDGQYGYRNALTKSDRLKSRFRHTLWYSKMLKLMWRTGLTRLLKKLFVEFPLMLKQPFIPTKLHIHMDISSAVDGYELEPHHDSESRVAVFLIFFSSREEVGGTGGEFCIYKSRPDDDGSFPMIPDASDLELYLAIPPTKNLMFSFLSTPNSYHGVPVMRDSVGARKFIYVAVTANKTNFWGF